jgi:hypothetical protein
LFLFPPFLNYWLYVPEANSSAKGVVSTPPSRKQAENEPQGGAARAAPENFGPHLVDPGKGTNSLLEKILIHGENNLEINIFAANFAKNAVTDGHPCNP